MKGGFRHGSPSGIWFCVVFVLASLAQHLTPVDGLTKESFSDENFQAHRFLVQNWAIRIGRREHWVADDWKLKHYAVPSLSMRCHAQHFTPIFCRRWVEDGRNRTEKARCQEAESYFNQVHQWMGEQTSLTLRAVGRDRGTYECRPSDVPCNETLPLWQTRVMVFGDEKAPWVKSFANVIATANNGPRPQQKTIYLNVADGDEDVEINCLRRKSYCGDGRLWLELNERPIVDFDASKGTVDEDDEEYVAYTHLIKRAAGEDGGIYECVVSCGERSTIKVRFKASPHNGSVEISVVENEPITLKCGPFDWQNDLGTSSTWTFRSSANQSGDFVGTPPDDSWFNRDKYHYRINNVRPSHDGVWSCEAENMVSATVINRQFKSDTEHSNGDVRLCPDEVKNLVDSNIVARKGRWNITLKVIAAPTTVPPTTSPCTTTTTGNTSVEHHSTKETRAPALSSTAEAISTERTTQRETSTTQKRTTVRVQPATTEKGIADRDVFDTRNLVVVGGTCVGAVLLGALGAIIYQFCRPSKRAARATKRGVTV